MPGTRAQMAAKNIQGGLYQSAKELAGLMDVRVPVPSPYVDTMSTVRLSEPTRARIPPSETPRIPSVDHREPRIERTVRGEEPRVPPREEPRVEPPRTPLRTPPFGETPRVPPREPPRDDIRTTPRIGTPRITRATTRITPPVVRIPPPRIVPPRIKPPKPFPAKLSGQQSFGLLTTEQRLASVAWKQGWIYHLIYPPYGQTNVLHSRFPFPHVKMHKGAKSAYESLTRIKGNVLPEKIYWNMGAVDITFKRGQGKVKMEFKDYKQGQPRIRRPEGMPQAVTTSRRRVPSASGVRF
jgi:hypothetical protein